MTNERLLNLLSSSLDLHFRNNIECMNKTPYAGAQYLIQALDLTEEEVKTFGLDSFEKPLSFSEIENYLKDLGLNRSEYTNILYRVAENYAYSYKEIEARLMLINLNDLPYWSGIGPKKAAHIRSVIESLKKGGK